jgi:hypothetical protein
MARDFETPTIYDPITEDGMYSSYIWASWLVTFYETLIGYLSQNGIFVPKLTTAQRNSVTNPEDGQIIYNTDYNSVEYYMLGTWGFFTPQLTTTQRNNIVSPRNGQLIYNTTTNKIQAYENNVWTNLI